MHVETSRRHHVRKDGTEQVYERHLLRRSYRDERGRPAKETLANLSALPGAAIEAIRTVLRGGVLVDPDADFEVERSLPHGHVAAVHAMARRLGFPEILGSACRQRDICLALIIARVCRPASKLATTRWWADTTLAHDLGVADATTDEVYAAMDWLAARQDAIEKVLAGRHLTEGGIAMFDLTSSWVEGRCCPLAARGYSRDGKKGRDQIEYGLLTEPEGRPVAVRVFPGNTADPAAFTAIAAVVREQFGLSRLTLVGDRGMITSARIRAIKDDNEAGESELGWLTALRAGQVAALAKDGGPLQMSLFDDQDLAEITHPDYPGERLIACKNPALADERARTRADLLAATDTELDKVVAAVEQGRLADPGKIGVRVGKVIGRYKMEKHYRLDIGAGRFTYTHDDEAIAAEAALDGIYVLRTTLPAASHTAADVVVAYKQLANLERDFRSLKTIDLDLRPIHHYLESRVRSHVLICMLAAYLLWHLRQALAPLTYTDEHPPERDNPVTKATRSEHAKAKAAHHTDDDGQDIRGFTGLLDHLATLNRELINAAGHTFTKITQPTPVQRRAFELLHTPIPITLA
jgi:hypothetical protein